MCGSIANGAGGESVAENCQILQTRVNRLKSDKSEIDVTQLKGYSCDVKFTGTIPSIIFPCFPPIFNIQLILFQGLNTLLVIELPL